ncbi:MAG: peptide-N-glycosidase F-related protein [Candidatus Thermoplasmatota archaeon]|nr:peptide-N-glycosidase F-related protein [Candidatus Thermoplasmatota archaeon]
MANKPFLAVLLSLLMLSGCFGNSDTNTDVVEEEPVPIPFTLTAEWDKESITGELGEITNLNVLLETTGQGDYSVEASITHTGEAVSQSDYSITKKTTSISVVLLPDKPGTYVVDLTILPTEGELISMTNTIEILLPEEGTTSIVAPQFLVVEAAMLVLQGQVLHQTLETCTTMIEINEEDSSVTTNALPLQDDGSFSYILNDLDVRTETFFVRTSALCGEYTLTEDSKNITIIVEENNDADGDGIQDSVDLCLDGYGETDGWASNAQSDADQDGCRDFDEDLDDDNDGIMDANDGCTSSLGWTSTLENDRDQDGCHDDTNDDDDDGDGILDVNDACLSGEINWPANLYNDWDQDGCNDLLEDSDDDNDGELDATDGCPKGRSNWQSERTMNTDFDMDGCYDATEDVDDDNDNVNDVNATGATLDLCPTTPANATDVDEFGCAAIERDTDGDGVNDLIDACEGTPSGLTVNSVGCADLDGDGVFANVDICADSPARWTIDVDGCAIVQKPVQWTAGTSVNGPMDIVPTFTVPTLDGTFTFQNKWTGNDVYLFMFKYTDGSGNSNSATWSTNPGTFIRNLPDNTHLFYGSFDSSYHNDVLSRKSDVEARLNPSEEEQWDGRIHYIDMDASNIQGGLGQMISNFNSPFFMGIDRFQRARDTGSIYAWISQTNDPFHYTYEPHQWNAEFEPEIRMQDSGIDVVTLYDFERHAGGWGANHNSYRNATFTLPENLSSYDTLEVFHEHACDERANRYQKSDGSYGGCHEWDYLAHLYICDADNSSICGTEFMRWITTYGREGRWLTDISPYLFMLEDDQERRFRYKGANKGDLTIKFLFSNWGSGERAFDAEFGFTGGQFDGTYNNESRYVRSLNFTVPSETTRVEIVATITGHGFQQDDANCAEFCDHQHHYYMDSHHTYEWHPIVYSNTGCENEVNNGVVANQFGSWPFGRAGWCAGQDVKQWSFDITSWVDMNGQNNELTYRGLFNGQEYNPTGESSKGGRNIVAEIWVVFYTNSTA